MFRYFLILLFSVFSFASCREKRNPYKNSLGIKESVVASMDTANYTRVLWLDSIQNFGAVNEGASVKINFRFKNTGDKILFITGVRASCGCTIADYPENAFRPGEEGTVTALFTTRGHPGYARKTITVSTNTNNHVSRTLAFFGEVKKKDSSLHK